MGTPSARRRAEFYEQLAVYLDAGTPIEEALTSLSTSHHFGIRRICMNALGGIKAGHTFANALLLAPPYIPKFEVAMLHASELTGRLPIGCKLLAETLTRWADLKREVIIGSIYPGFMLHFAILLLPLPTAFSSAGWGWYFRTVLLLLFALHGTVWGSIILMRMLKRSGGTAAVFAESLIRIIPIAGKTWWSMVVGRFARAYDGMLNAGANVVQALDVASQAANSVTLRRKIEEIMPMVQQGQQVGPLLQAKHALGNPWEEFWVTGEKSGRQEEMLNHVVTETSKIAEKGIRMLTMGVPKAILISVVIIIFIQLLRIIMQFLVPYYQEVNELLK